MAAEEGEVLNKAGRRSLGTSRKAHVLVRGLGGSAERNCLQRCVLQGPGVGVLALYEVVQVKWLVTNDVALRSDWSSSLGGVSQMDSILPERLLALGNDLVLRRIRSLKRCVEAWTAK